MKMGRKIEKGQQNYSIRFNWKKGTSWTCKYKIRQDIREIKLELGKIILDLS